MYRTFLQGRNLFAQVLYQGVAMAGPFYIGLGVGGLPANENKTLADVVEVTGTGYSRKPVTRTAITGGFTVSGDTATATTVTFTNSGTADWVGADYAFITLSPSGTSSPNILIGAVELAVTETLEAGESLPISFDLPLL